MVCHLETELLMSKFLTGGKTSFARKDKEENPGSSRFWERRITESKHVLLVQISPLASYSTSGLPFWCCFIMEISTSVHL